MTVQETINEAIACHGIAAVLDAVKESFDFYKCGHKYRREFCETAKSLICVLTCKLASITAKYGYVPGKE